MQQHRQTESSWQRAKKDTAEFRDSGTWFWVIEVLGAAVFALGGAFGGWALVPERASGFQQFAVPTVGGAIGVVLGPLFSFGIVYLWNLVYAPQKQRDEARTIIAAYEEQKKPCVQVQPIPCKPLDYEQTRHTAWAALRVTNSSDVPLEDVRVQIQDCITVFKKQQEPDAGKYFLVRLQPWIPTNVFWSERNANPKTLSLPIPAGSTREAVVAFHAVQGVDLAIINAPTFPPLLESKIEIEISSPGMNTWRRSYYLEYHPARTDSFEFVEWDSWCRSHELIGQPTN